MQTPQIEDIRRDLIERRRDVIYDRVRLPAGSRVPGNFALFQVPIGCRDHFDPYRYKTFNDTNMMEGGRFPESHAMIARRVVLLFQPSTSATDRAGFLSRFSWEFTVMNKVYQRTPTVAVSAVGRPEFLIKDFGNHTTSSDFEKLGKGQAWDLGEFSGQVLYIPPMAPFHVRFDGVSFELEQDFDFYFLIEGLRDWPVQ